MVAAAMIGSAAIGAVASSSKSGGGGGGSTTTTQQQTIDPRMQAYLYGDGTSENPGLLGKIMSTGGQPRTAGTAAFGAGADQFLGGYGATSLAAQQAAANKLQGSDISAPAATAASVWGGPRMQAASSGGVGVGAPGQNSLDLKGSYDKMINGDAGANPYLTGALQSAVNQTNASYAQNQNDLTNTLQRSVLPQISSNAVLAGQYGGSRQGIAEGNAISDFTKQLTNSNLQLGLANSANTLGQQAASFNAGQDRALNAMNTLSGQQYGAATTNAQLGQQNSLANAGFQQAANAQNSAQGHQTSLTNAGFQQQTGLANQSAQLGTNQLNSANQATGLGANSSLLGTAYQYANANDQYQLNRNGQVASQLAPFTGLNSAMGTTSPLYSNPVGGALGGAMTGLGVYNAYNNASKNAYNGAYNQFASNNAGLSASTGLSTNDLLGAF